ncbi:MAG TPA: hypothetical protein VFH73_08815 [Polyangia bacterium]|nr:hypothetical protein [Polyangia bacterium]
MKRIAAPLMVVAAVAAGCDRGPSEQARARTASLEQALRPSFFAAAVRKMGGGHYRGSARFAIGPDGKGPDSVTTTTDVWLDRAGNYRVVESNDHDGGREVVLAGHELHVALRYGKMIRRIAEEPEPTRILEEALGGPWAGWEVIAPAAAIEPGQPQLVAGARAQEYRLAKAAAVAAKPRELPRLRKWRGTVTVHQLDGHMLVDERSGALIKADLRAAYTLTQEGRPMYGTIDVQANLTEAAAIPPIQKPASEELSFRQRIVPEQKELLGGLGGRVPPPVPEPPKPKKKKESSKRK